MINDTGLEASKLYKYGDTFLEGSTIINSDHPYLPVDGCYDGDPSEYVVPYQRDQTTGKWLVTIPTFTGNLTYNGFWYTPEFNDFNAQYMFIDGKQSAKDPGTYTVTFTLANTEKFMWADRDESHSDRDVDWSIGRATGHIEVSADDITFNDKYGQTQISFTAHTNNLEFVSSNPSISATCSNNIIFIKATAAKNGDYTLTVIAPQTGAYTEARLVIDVHVIFTQIGSDLYLTEQTVAYGDQQLQRRWSRINQTIDEICAEVGYQNQQLGNTINSLSRVKINADESKSEIELLCHYDKNGEGADAVIRLRAISDTMAGAIKAHSQIYMAADWIQMEGYTTINGSFQIADSSAYFQTLGYQAGDVFFKNAYIGSPTAPFARIGYNSSLSTYGFWGDWFNLYKETTIWTYSQWSGSYTRGTLDLYTTGTVLGGSSTQMMKVSPDGIEFNSWLDSDPSGTKVTSAINVKHVVVGGQPILNTYLDFSTSNTFSGKTITSAGKVIVMGDTNYVSAGGDICNGVQFDIVAPTLPSIDGTYPPQLKLSAVSGTIGGVVTSSANNSVGVWQPGRLIIGTTEMSLINDVNQQAYAPKASIDGALVVKNSVYCDRVVTNSTSSSSDRRSKKDIEPLDNRYIDLFDNLDVVRFKWVVDEDNRNRYNIGLIAQDVMYESDKSGLTIEDQGYVFGGEYSKYSLDYNQLAMLTMFKVKKMAEEYENRISTLEAKIDTLLREKGE